MMRLLTFWDSIRSSYWFLPAVMTTGAILLSTATVAVDYALRPADRHDVMIWLYTGGAEGARTLLAMLAASMLTIFSVVFSILIVALTLASSQFGPRLVRTFLSDTADQLAVGTFIGTFTYCLLVLRTVRSGGGAEFVPHVSVTVAIVLALASLGELIYFINHLSTSLQAPYIVAAVGADLARTIEREFVSPSESVDCEISAPLIDALAAAGAPVSATGSGYVQAIDYQMLAAVAKQHDLLFRICVYAGDFVAHGDRIAFSSATGIASGDLDSVCTAALVLGKDRTHEQDPEYPINQLVQLAVRALSPAINDPITAMIAIDHLRAGLCRIAELAAPFRFVSDDEGVVRLLVERRVLRHIAESSFSLLRQYGRGNLEVCLALLNAIGEIARRATNTEFHRALLDQAKLIEHGAQSGLPEEADRCRVAECFHRVITDSQTATPAD
ncbi:MAG: DUF2254 domain-containing protein [Planctomycetaceae bacterium]